MGGAQQRRRRSGHGLGPLVPALVGLGVGAVAPSLVGCEQVATWSIGDFGGPTGSVRVCEPQPVPTGAAVLVIGAVIAILLRLRARRRGTPWSTPHAAAMLAVAVAVPVAVIVVATRRLELAVSADLFDLYPHADPWLVLGATLVLLPVALVLVLRHAASRSGGVITTRR